MMSCYPPNFELMSEGELEDLNVADVADNAAVGYTRGIPKVSFPTL